MSWFSITKQWQSHKARVEGAKAIYYMLLMALQQNDGRTGQGVQLAKNADNADLARYISRKYPQMVATLLADKIVVSLRGGFDSVISADLRAHLERSGVHGQAATEAYAEAANAAKDMGTKQTVTLVNADGTRLDIEAVPPEVAPDVRPEPIPDYTDCKKE